MYPTLILEVSDLILKNLEEPLIINEACGLLYNFKSCTNLPQSLQVLIKNYDPDPEVEQVKYVKPRS